MGCEEVRTDGTNESRLKGEQRIGSSILTLIFKEVELTAWPEFGGMLCIIYVGPSYL